MAGGLGDLIKQVVAAFSGSGSGGGSSNSKQQVIDYLTDKGYSNEAVAGITANIEVETGGTFDYKQKELDDAGKPKKDGGEGLFQFGFAMKNSYNDYLKNKKQKDSIESQIDFMDEVVKGTWSPGLPNMDTTIIKGELFSGKFGPDRIAESFNTLFEEGQLQTKYGNRKDIAIDIYKDL
jgi:hypothetical protein